MQVFIIYQVIHSCRSQYGYHHQYSDYDTQIDYIHNSARRAQRNVQPRFVTVHRPPEGPLDNNIGRSYSTQNGNYSDQDVVVVPYPVPVLIFPINKAKEGNKTQTSSNTTKNANQSRTTSKKPNTTSKKPNTTNTKKQNVVKPEKTDESNLRPEDFSQETDKSDQKETTIESEIQARKMSKNTQDYTEHPEIIKEETPKPVKTVEQPAQETPKSAEKIKSTQKINKDGQESAEAAQDLEDIVNIINEDNKPVATKQQNDVYKQTSEPTFTESNVDRNRLEAARTYKPLRSNAKYMFLRGKGPPHLGPRRPKGPPISAQGIRLRPTIEHTKLKATTKTNTKLIRRRRFNMPKYGLVPIPNDLAEELRSQMDKNVI